MTEVGIITSDHIRHRYLVREIQKDFPVTCLVVEAKPPISLSLRETVGPIVGEHFRERNEVEEKYFGSLGDFDAQNRLVKKMNWGEVNSGETFEWVTGRSPDLIVLFGSSIVKEPLLSQYEGRMINMHLGLSPYYRGSGTNFWPLVDGYPECVGVTIHHAALKVDAGNIIAQGRPDTEEGDGCHDLGCKSVMEGAGLLLRILAEFGRGPFPGLPQTGGGRLCRRKDFTVDALIKMKKNFANGMVQEYLKEKRSRDQAFPIVGLQGLTGVVRAR